jgi:hypothetical protein
LLDRCLQQPPLTTCPANTITHVHCCRISRAFRCTREQPRQLVVARGILDAYRRDKGLAVPTEQQQQGSTGLLERASKGLGGVRCCLLRAPGHKRQASKAAGTVVRVVLPPERTCMHTLPCLPHPGLVQLPTSWSSVHITNIAAEHRSAVLRTCSSTLLPCSPCSSCALSSSSSKKQQTRGSLMRTSHALWSV